MKTIKKILIIAAVIMIVVGLNQAVYAARALNGVTLNGVTLNGTCLNGVSFNGVTLNGTALQGTSLNGTALQGTSLNGTALQGTSLNGTMLQGTSLNGRQFHGKSLNMPGEDTPHRSAPNTESMKADSNQRQMMKNFSSNGLRLNVIILSEDQCRHIVPVGIAITK